MDAFDQRWQHVAKLRDRGTMFYARTGDSRQI